MTDQPSGPKTLAIDIGGSGLKMLVLDAAGDPVTKRTRKQTPKIPVPQAVLDVLNSMIPQHGEFDRVSAGFPGVVADGEIRTAANLHDDWLGFNLATALAESTGKPTRVANDADVQGLGSVAGKGIELVITLGTGMGSALFLNGRLVPNLELPHHPLYKGKTYEECVGEEARKKLGAKKWNSRVELAIETLRKAFNYRMLYIGGGNAKRLKFKLPPDVQLVANVTGLLGGIALWRDG
jgi:polyphosphate glucokinase